MKSVVFKIVLPLFCIAATSAFAADTGAADGAKSRADVKAETRAALPTGPMAKQGEATAAQAADSKAPVGTKSRADVKAETRDAVRSNNLPQSGESVAAEAGDQKNAVKKPAHKKTHQHAPAAAGTTAPADMPAK